MGSGGLPAIIWAIVALGLAWLGIAAAVSVIAARRFRLAEQVLEAARANATLLELSPARALVVHANDRIEGDARLFRELGLDADTKSLDSLAPEGKGLNPDDLTS